MCLRGGGGGGASLLQTGGGRPPALNSNAVGCVWLVGPLSSARQFVSSVALHGSHLGLELSLRPGRWSRWRWPWLFTWEQAAPPV